MNPTPMLSALTGNLQNLLAFVFVIGLLVIVHEWGHYRAARRNGIFVKEFSIGFGQVVKRLGVRDGTVFNLRLFPLGGFVSMAGMEPGDDDPQGFNAKPLLSRAQVIAAGPTVNLVFGFLVMVAMGVTLGLPRQDTSKAIISQVQPNSAAEKAGIQVEDRLLTIAGEPISDSRKAPDLIRKHPGERIQVVIERNGRPMTVTVVPAAEKEDGKVIGRLGVGIAPGFQWVRTGIVGAFWEGARDSLGMARSIIETVFSRRAWKQREFGGPVAIYTAAGSHAQQGLPHYVFFIAMFSINLGIFNLLPLPVLDGGHLVLLSAEAIRRRRLARETVLAFQSVGVVLLFAFFVFVMWSDIARILPHG